MSTPESREEEIEEDPMEDDPEVIQALNQAKQVPRTPQDVWDNLRKCDEPGMNTRDTVSSIEIFRQSLPELDNRAFDRMYRLAFIRAHAGLLGYERRRGEDWDPILDCLEAEQERRYGTSAKPGQGP